MMPVKWLPKEKCITLLSKAVYGRLATCGNDGRPYITSINFVVIHGKIFIHTGFQGRKLDNIKSNPKVCFEVSRSGKIYATPHARNFTMRFWSVLVSGEANEVEDRNLKLMVLNLIMDKHARGYRYETLTVDDMDGVNVIEISIDEITGKVSVDPPQK